MRRYEESCKLEIPLQYRYLYFHKHCHAGDDVDHNAGRHCQYFHLTVFFAETPASQTSITRSDSLHPFPHRLSRQRETKCWGGHNGTEHNYGQLGQENTFDIGVAAGQVSFLFRFRIVGVILDKVDRPQDFDSDSKNSFDYNGARHRRL